MEISSYCKQKETVFVWLVEGYPTNEYLNNHKHVVMPIYVCDE
jgi:hypothetical protein